MSQMHGRSGDYAWGPQGLDNIISQMLTNLEDNGPPPAEGEKIEALPTVSATEEAIKLCERRGGGGGGLLRGGLILIGGLILRGELHV